MDKLLFRVIELVILQSSSILKGIAGIIFAKKSKSLPPAQVQTELETEKQDQHGN